MRHTPWKARRKLFASLAVLGIVLIIAAIAQFTGKHRSESLQATAAESRPKGRAVFGGDPPPQPAPDPETSNRSRSEPAVERPDTAGIQQLLTRWRDTVAKGDLEGHTNLYASNVDRFFRQRNVPHEAVRKVKSQMMTLYPTITRYDISKVTVESNTGDEAVVSFRKDWDMKGRRRFAGAERQRLKLRRIAGDWKITSEEELKIYWVRRG